MTLTAQQTQLYRTAIKIGQRHGVGGSSWTVSRPSTADNIITQASVTSAGTKTLYVLRERLVQYGTPQPPITVGTDRWRLIAPADTDIRTGDIITSVDDDILRFVVGPIEIDQGYPTAIVEPKQ